MLAKGFDWEGENLLFALSKRADKDWWAQRIVYFLFK